jgi:hypothetical protein
MLTEGRQSAQRGNALIQVMIVLVFIGLVSAVGATEWIQGRKAAECTQAVRLWKSFLLEARMLSVYKGNDHFVVFDPATRVLSLYADTATPLGVFTTADTRIRMEQLPKRVTLALPASPSPLASPLGTGNVASAWDIALPDTSGAWGNNLRGVRATPVGLIETVEATPHTVTTGTIVLTDIDGYTVAVGVRGQMGSVRSFKLLNNVWSEL